MSVILWSRVIRFHECGWVSAAVCGGAPGRTGPARRRAARERPGLGRSTSVRAGSNDGRMSAAWRLDCHILVVIQYIYVSNAEASAWPHAKTDSRLFVRWLMDEA